MASFRSSLAWISTMMPLSRIIKWILGTCSPSSWGSNVHTWPIIRILFSPCNSLPVGPSSLWLSRRKATSLETCTKSSTYPKTTYQRHICFHLRLEHRNLILWLFLRYLHGLKLRFKQVFVIIMVILILELLLQRIHMVNHLIELTTHSDLLETVHYHFHLVQRLNHHEIPLVGHDFLPWLQVEGPVLRYSKVHLAHLLHGVEDHLIFFVDSIIHFVNFRSEILHMLVWGIFLGF